MQSPIGRRGVDGVNSDSGLSEGKPVNISDEELKWLKLGYETYGPAGAWAIARAMGYRVAPDHARGAVLRSAVGNRKWWTLRTAEVSWVI